MNTSPQGYAAKVSSALQNPADLLVNAILTMPYGQILTHQDICTITGIPYTGFRAYTDIKQMHYAIIGKVRVKLITLHRRVLDSIPGYGYQILKPIDHLGYCGRKNMLGLRMMMRGMDAILAIPSNLLTPPEQQIVSNYSTAMNGLINHVGCEIEKLQQTNSNPTVTAALKQIQAAWAQVATTDEGDNSDKN